MSWKPIVPNVEEWKKHFLQTSNMKYIPNQKSYVIGQFGKGESFSQPKIEGGPVVTFETDEPKPKKKKKQPKKIVYTQ